MFKYSSHYFKWPCHGPGSYSPASHRGSLGQSRSVRLRFVVDTVALRQVLLRVIRFILTCNTPRTIRTRLHLHVASYQKDKVKKQCAFGYLNRKNFHLVFKELMRKVFFKVLYLLPIFLRTKFQRSRCHQLAYTSTRNLYIGPHPPSASVTR